MTARRRRFSLATCCLLRTPEIVAPTCPTHTHALTPGTRAGNVAVATLCQCVRPRALSLPPSHTLLLQVLRYTAPPSPPAVSPSPASHHPTCSAVSPSSSFGFTTAWDPEGTLLAFSDCVSRLRIRFCRSLGRLVPPLLAARLACLPAETSSLLNTARALKSVLAYFFFPF